MTTTNHFLIGESYKYVDGTFVKQTDEERLADHARHQAEEKALIEAGGCAHDGEWVHSTFRSSRGGMQDAYYCHECKELMQVG